jgi:hypothetical protein
MAKKKSAKERDAEFEKEMREAETSLKRVRDEFDGLVVSVLDKLSPEARGIAMRMYALAPSKVIRPPKRKYEDGETVMSLFASLRGKSTSQIESEVLAWAEDLKQFGRIQ